MDYVPPPVDTTHSRNGFKDSMNSHSFDWDNWVKNARINRSAALMDMDSSVDTVTVEQRKYLKMMKDIEKKQIEPESFAIRKVDTSLLFDYSEVNVLRNRVGFRTGY